MFNTRSLRRLCGAILFSLLYPTANADHATSADGIRVRTATVHDTIVADTQLEKYSIFVATSSAHPVVVSKTESVSCRHQALMPGTLVSNIDRILRDCGRLLGEWPLLEKGIYDDYLIRERQPLPGVGDLKSLFTFVKEEYGFMPTFKPHGVGVVVDFVAVE